jgi:hypothetical protein
MAATDTRDNRRDVGSGVFYAVRADILYAGRVSEESVSEELVGDLVRSSAVQSL